MRKISVTLLCVAAWSCSGGSSSRAPTSTSTRNPVAVTAGTSTGPQTTMSIGPGGGTLSSGDGRLQLTVPAGALSAPTTLGIEPITSTAPLAAGGAYRLTPEGTTFAVPATITISFTNADLVGSSSDALSIGYQSSDGYWHAMASPAVDASAQTVSVSTVHLSDWSMLYGWQLRPPSATVAPLGTLALALKYCEPDMFTDPEGDSLSGLVPNCDGGDSELPPLVTVNGWYVNGGGGSSVDGTVQGTGPSATYTAPGAAPPQNPVAVSVDFNGRGNMKTLAVSNVTVRGNVWSGTVSWSMMTSQSTMVTAGTGTDTTTESSSGTASVTSDDLTIDPLAINWTVGSLSGTYQYTHDLSAVTTMGQPCVYTDTREEHDKASGTWALADVSTVSFSNLPTPSDPPGTFHFYFAMAAPSVPEDLKFSTNETLSGNCGGATPAPPTSSDSSNSWPVPSIDVQFTSAPDQDASTANVLAGSTTVVDSSQRPYVVTWSLSRN